MLTQIRKLLGSRYVWPFEALEIEYTLLALTFWYMIAKISGSHQVSRLWVQSFSYEASHEWVAIFHQKALKVCGHVIFTALDIDSQQFEQEIIVGFHVREQCQVSYSTSQVSCSRAVSGLLSDMVLRILVFKRY